MRRSSAPLWLVLGLAWLAACSAPSSDTGSARFAVSLEQAVLATATSVSRISVTSSGPDIPSVTVDLAPSGSVWGGTIGNLPAGPHRSFVARAYDASGALRFQGSASDVTIAAGQTALVALLLQEVDAPPPVFNEAPVIDSLVASSTTVPVGGTLSLVATAHDPGSDVALSFAWSASAGTFSAATTASTSWKAPATPGMQTLLLTVKDAQGLSSQLHLAVYVFQGEEEGEARLSISFNSAPRVVSLGAAPTQLVVGARTVVSVSATDAEGDSLAYAWSATCAGTWGNATSASAHFTPSALPSGACNNCNLSVTVTDGRGGQGMGTVALCVRSPSSPAPFPPVIIRSYRSSDTAAPQQVLTYEVEARDPQDSTLGFTWAASTGVLGTANTRELSSRITWTAPACASQSPVITATVTNAFGLTATRRFTVSGLPSCSGWKAAGTMLQNRMWHTATRLLDGRVLVVGGRGGGYLRTAELYDPASGTWGATGSLRDARYYHTSALLPSGQVLIAGGYNGGYLGTAEVYDPATGTWRTTGSLGAARVCHTMTRLLDGRVLVTGGYTGGNRIGTVEVYNPATGIWSRTADMSSARCHHTATLLPDGRVLVVGGQRTGVDFLGSAEVYDPATGTWSMTGSMPLGRYHHSATLLPNGQVLIAGGFEPNAYVFNTGVLYDPATGTWTSAGSLAFMQGGQSETLLPDGRVLLTGGYENNVGATSAQLYHPGSSAWSVTSPMLWRRFNHQATLLLDGTVLISGGDDGRDLFPPERYTP